ncbi:M6 family metalloprotease domain-containing protein [Colwelliaceae bacterium 6441]
MLKKLLVILSVFIYSCVLHATQPPTKKQIDKYKDDGTLKQRINQAKAFNTHSFDKTLVTKFQRKHALPQKNQSLKSSQANDPLTGYFPSLGSPKMLVLLVEFQDYVHSDINSRASVEDRIFGEGNPDEYPYDSQNSFYKRSSYNKLDIQGNVLEWFQTDYDRPLDEGNSWQVKQQVIKDAINYHDAQGHDFSQYDNDNNGTLDYVAVIWTGPTGEWASLWWGTFSGFNDDSFVVDGKTINDISWQQISYSEEEGPFSPSTLIHETGHALGLPDFYDYDDDIGPRGGLGGMDQMAGGHDHNAFTKYILGWLTPTVINGTETDMSLLPLSTNANALLIKKEADSSTKYDEFFIAEYRDKNLNDQGLPGEGLVVWHIDATLNEWGWFKNNNSYSEHKFIRLVQADGLDEIELNRASADKGDFFTTGQEFSPNSFPASKLNDGSHSGAVIHGVNHQQAKVDLTAQVYPSVINFSIDNIEDRSIARMNQQVTLDVDNADDVEKIELYSNDTLIKTLTEQPFVIDINNDLLSVGLHQLKVVATDHAGFSSSDYKKVLYLDGQPIHLTINLGNEQDELLESMTEDAEMNVVPIDFLVPLTTNDFSLVHLNYGTYTTPWIENEYGSLVAYSNTRSATSEEMTQIESYIEQGGNLILEGEYIVDFSSRLQDLLNISLAHSKVDINTVSAENIYENNNIDVDLSNNNRLIYADFFQPNGEDFTSLLTAAGEYNDTSSGQWLDAEGVCSFSKNVGENAAKVVVSSCLLQHFQKYPKALVYNNYLKFFGIEDRLSLNSPPEINAGDNLNVNERSVITLNALATDADGDSLTVSWLQLSGTSVTLSNDDTLSPHFTAPEVNELETLIFELSVTDGIDTVTDTIEISVVHVNRVPTISLGNNQSVTEGTTVNLSATISDDDSDELEFSWQQIAGAEVSLSNTDTLAPSFTAPNVTANTTLTFELTVSDGTDTVSSSVTITVRPESTSQTNSNSGSSGGGSIPATALLFLLTMIVLRKKA